MEPPVTETGSAIAEPELTSPQPADPEPLPSLNQQTLISSIRPRHNARSNQ